jgi:hypothetical protein
MAKWGKDPANRGQTVPGDDRSPAWRWIGNLYVEGGAIVMPADNIMSVLREGGKRCPTGKGKSTFKAQTQSGIVVDQGSWPITIGGKPVPYAPVKELIGNPDFEAHCKLVSDLGFELFVKRAALNGSKNVRVRPRFDKWECQGTVTVFDDMITTDVLKNILAFAGAYAGFGDWRPSAPKSPGPFGKFVTEVAAA